MTDETALVVQEQPLSIPQMQERANLVVKAMQTVMQKGVHYGTIPGTPKPTLLKPGAEKLCVLFRLATVFECVDKAEEWDKGFFHYHYRCKLVHQASGVIVATGEGSCNSREKRYAARWAFGSQVPPHVNKDALPTRTIETRNGPAKQYMVPNEDIYSQVNTILKMAQKRALVDATLKATAASDVFTQDIEDLVDDGATEASAAQAPATETAQATATQAKSAPRVVDGAKAEEEDEPTRLFKWAKDKHKKTPADTLAGLGVRSYAQWGKGLTAAIDTLDKLWGMAKAS